MQTETVKTIFITGATDGIGLETAKKLVSLGHNVLLHGRNQEKLQNVISTLNTLGAEQKIEGYIADLSSMQAVKSLAAEVVAKHDKIDVLINNAGVLKTSNTITPDGLDVRFAVNTLAPILLTQQLLPLLSQSTSRVVNLSSAAQAPVNLQALNGLIPLTEMEAYAQSKLALTIWSQQYSKEVKDSGPILIAVNPGSLLASKMVKEGFGIAGNDLSIGANILTRLALEEEFSNASGLYFDNDIGHLNQPHPDAADPKIVKTVIDTIHVLLNKVAQ